MPRKPSADSRTPPVSAYSTFKNFLLDYKDSRPPQRIDSTVLKNLSGTLRAQLAQALRFFKLIDDENYSQPGLENLVKLEGDEFRAELRKIAQEPYAFLLDHKGFNLSNATDSQLNERFSSTGLGTELARKARAFFLHYAADAGIEVSSFITPPKKRGEGKKGGGVRKTGQRVEKPLDSGKNGKTTDEIRGNTPSFMDAMIYLSSVVARDAESWSLAERSLYVGMVNALIKRK